MNMSQRALPPPAPLPASPTLLTGELLGAGLPEDGVRRFAEPFTISGELGTDLGPATSRLELGQTLVERLPAKPRRTELEQQAAAALLHALDEIRAALLRCHAGSIYASLTADHTTPLRVDELVYLAADRYPGLLPTRAAVTAERAHQLKDKDGIEVAQGLFLSAVMALPRPGTHLAHAMLLPTPGALERLEDFRRSGIADLGTARVERRGTVGHVELSNPGYLNAEDDTTLEAQEIAVDLVLLDPDIEIGVLRGGTVDHPLYAGRHVFSAGINLTLLYHGQLTYLFYISRELGLVNKLYRGLAGANRGIHEPEATHEKPWIAAVEAFAIGGGCQLLLVVDHVLAERGAFFNLPARREGIIPGAANLRLPRFVGDRLARQAILGGREFFAGTPEGDLLCDEVVEPGTMDGAIDHAVAGLTGSGLVSAGANRKALRAGQEPLASFLAYMAVYAREQASCHFSPALIRNLEQNWNAQERRPRPSPASDDRSV